MGKEKESKSKISEQQEDPILIALKHRWIELPSGIFIPERLERG